MNYLKKIRKILIGGVTGSVVIISGPLTPTGIPGEFYTLEELQYQKPAAVQPTSSGEWIFTWVNSKGFILRQKNNASENRPVPLRHAIYRTVTGPGSYSNIHKGEMP